MKKTKAEINLESVFIFTMVDECNEKKWFDFRFLLVLAKQKRNEKGSFLHQMWAVSKPGDVTDFAR